MRHIAVWRGSQSKNRSSEWIEVMKQGGQGRRGKGGEDGEGREEGRGEGGGEGCKLKVPLFQ